MLLQKAALCIAVGLMLASPSYAATKDIVYASESTAKSMDPHDTSDTYSGAIQRAMFQGLLGFDENLNVIPVLAESYTFNDTATEFTFKLRKGVKFHDGAPFNAEAVKVNIDRMMTGKYKRSSLMKPVKEVTVVDDSTIRFTLKEPFGAFANTIAHPGSPSAAGRRPPATPTGPCARWWPPRPSRRRCPTSASSPTRTSTAISRPDSPRRTTRCVARPTASCRTPSGRWPRGDISSSTPSMRPK